MEQKRLAKRVSLKMEKKASGMPKATRSFPRFVSRRCRSNAFENGKMMIPRRMNAMRILKIPFRNLPMDWRISSRFIGLFVM